MSDKKSKQLCIKGEKIFSFEDEMSLNKFLSFIAEKCDKPNRHSNIRLKIINTYDGFNSFELYVIGDRIETAKEARQREKEEEKTTKNTISDMIEYREYLRLKQKFET